MEVIVKKFINLAFVLYRRILSPFLQVGFQVNCRFEETCSHHTQRMIRERGLYCGMKLGLVRFLKCNPFNFRS